jgi:hypothetical protein
VTRIFLISNVKIITVRRQKLFEKRGSDHTSIIHNNVLNMKITIELVSKLHA